MMSASQRREFRSSVVARVVLMGLGLGLASPGSAGTITFSGDLAGPAPLLTTINTPSLIAAGAAVPETIAATVPGVGSVSGTLLLSDVGNAPSIAISSLTVALAASGGGHSMGFGFTVNQDFAYSGASPLAASATIGAGGTFSGLNQILSFGQSSSIRGGPFPLSFVSLTPTLGGGGSSLVTETFPETKPLAPGGTATATVASAPGPLTLIYALSTTLINTSGSAGSTIVFTPGSGLSAPAAVPAPSGLILASLGLAGVALVGIGRRRASAM